MIEYRMATMIEKYPRTAKMVSVEDNTLLMRIHEDDPDECNFADLSANNEANNLVMRMLQYFLLKRGVEPEDWEALANEILDREGIKRS